MKKVAFLLIVVISVITLSCGEKEYPVKIKNINGVPVIQNPDYPILAHFLSPKPKK